MRLNPSHCVRRCWHDEASREELHDDASDVRNTHARSLGSPAPCALSQPCYRCRSVRGARCRLTAIGITSAKRSSAMPDLPTIAESGLPGYDFSTWYAFLIQSRAPKSVVAKLHAETAKALSQPDFRDRLAKSGIDAGGSSPAEATAYVSSEITKWAKVVKSSGMKLE